jgi:hypothetical protein
MKYIIPFLLLPGLISCQEKAPKPQGRANPAPISMFTDAPRDPVPDPTLLISLSVYRISVPARAVSHNEGFWKHVNEDNLVDVGTHDILFSNGFRAGVAPRSDWDYFKNILESNPVMSQLTRSSSMEAASFELPLKQNVIDQFIFYFHPTNGLIGQKYDRCNNSLMIRFEPTPKRPGFVRITVTPRLLSERTELVWTVRNNVRELTFEHPDTLFEMKLTVDVPLDQFLIVAPSQEADASSSLGRKFLYHESNGQEFESLLLISPQPFQLDKNSGGKPTTAPGK